MLKFKKSKLKNNTIRLDFFNLVNPNFILCKKYTLKKKKEIFIFN